MKSKEEMRESGKTGETALNDWLREQRLCYVAVCQAPEAFTPLFSLSVKRPDFLLLLESVGLIAIDAKNYTLSRGVYSLKLEAELKRSVAFERLFRIPVWYAYYHKKDEVVSWYWISALKAIEVGEERTNSTTKERFLALPRQHFEHIQAAPDLAKLYTHRLPGVKKVASLS